MSKEEVATSEPLGELALQTLAMPKDTNPSGDIFGGWLVSQMDLAAGIISKKVTKGRSATVAIQNVAFLRPVSVGSTVSCYCYVTKRGRTSLHIAVDVRTSHQLNQIDNLKVAEGLFVFVAIDDAGKSRPLPD
ncbi:MAG: acyl-CoA thioesterase [Gammaproteobacteria bacterium]|jgi:acyl-CoA thioesterase YciA|nr:acyl-CoA thioesterase [Gammaproteobacteria bacterium]MCH2342902.1 acyl-CoA thioesterase [Pseudomonadales bacterium]MEC9223990.1 acyl-CoA thioesterase [Pseudomonadota bacterium]MAU05182.1 acyl-CoA thioesterase [Gammaproteobacteria bacterium]MBE46605.1 acyl-CoA thioesterase [Gammaproteobacteria bacterium]|tara:strand:+ start:2637 stop:3035 length:399 start_codon:yes stop_codon:yes gene_type:complete